ncbi:transcription elongation factor, mitochondrial isoform X3 [Lethenteron reissneri]|uniref:transcription elongation factor, mitochondrial isoform X3 n=1 Tax=Lethenteron reissneri TaxID=7753 RepID=UPI002AB75109|nr:transcription elongation factor, mitochondrial isoform X3 [Lethenteron reissneri]
MLATKRLPGALWLGARLRGIVSARSRCAVPGGPEQPTDASTQQSDRLGEEIISTAERPRGEFSQSEVSTAELDRGPLSSEEHHTVEVPLDELFTAEQRATLLRTFNEASGVELGAMRALRGRKGANVAAFRDEHGPFRDLDSLTRHGEHRPSLVPYLKYKSLFKACTVLLQPKLSREAARQSKRLTFLKPDVSRESLETVRSVVSLVFGMHRVAWAHVTRSLDVLAWQQRRCDTIRTGSYAPNVYYEELRATVALIPKADLYVLERPSLPPGNTSLFPVVLHLRSMETTLFSLLSLREAAAAAAGTDVAVRGGTPNVRSCRHDNPWTEPPTTVPPPHPRVLGMSRSAVGQHFQLMLGSTKTSGREVVRRLLDEVLLLERPRVRVPCALASARDGRECEEMCDALLQALAFLELALGPAN